MNLFPELKKKYTKETMNAREAQRLAEFIAFGPVIFQTARIMLKLGIMDMIRNSENGLTIEEVADKANISTYAAKCLLEASLCIGTVLIDPQTDKFTISKTGWFLINDPATRVNIDFNHDVNYLGWFNLEESLLEGKPVGLKTLGDWPTVYEGLSSLPKHIQDSWFGFDHFYSDSSFDQALEIVFGNNPGTLLDVGGNTDVGRLRKMQELGADLPKIAVMPQNKRDVLTLLLATEEMTRKYADRPIITMSMAGTGVISRLCGEVFGSALTFGAAKKASAPGQMGVNELETVLRLLHRSL